MAFHLLKLATLALLLSFASGPAFAAGYTCISVDGETRINVLTATLETDSSARTIANTVEILDPNARKSSRLIARFASVDGFVATEPTDFGYRIVSQVDPANPGSTRKGRRVGGTVLGALKEIVLEIQTVSARHPIQILTDGAIYAAQTTFRKKNGQELKQDFDCQLFLTEDVPDGTP